MVISTPGSHASRGTPSHERGPEPAPHDEAPGPDRPHPCRGPELVGLLLGHRRARGAVAGRGHDRCDGASAGGVESRPVAGHSAGPAGRGSAAGRREGRAPPDGDRARQGADAVDGTAIGDAPAGHRHNRHLRSCAGNDAAARGDGSDHDTSGDHGPAEHGPTDHCASREEGSDHHEPAREGSPHHAADHESAHDDDGVHAAATARATAVHGIEVPLTEARADGYWTESRTRAMGTHRASGGRRRARGPRRVGARGDRAARTVLEPLPPRQRARDAARARRRVGRREPVDAAGRSRAPPICTARRQDCSIRRSSMRSSAPVTTVRSSSWSSKGIASAPDLRASPHAGSAGSTSTSTRRVCELPPGCGSISAGSARVSRPTSCRAGWSTGAPGPRS